MKKEAVDFVARSMTCQQIKIKHKRPVEIMQPLHIPKHKWEGISMDFFTGLPVSKGGKNTIWVIVDQLTKSTHFIAIQEAIGGELASIFF